MNADTFVTAADVMRTGIAPHDTSDWVAALVGLFTFAAAIYTARSSSRTEKRGQNIERDANIGQQWQFLTNGMRGEIDALRKQASAQNDAIKELQDADGQKRDQIAALMGQIGRLEQKLAEWRDYGLSLGRMLLELGHTPPEPPADTEQ